MYFGNAKNYTEKYAKIKALTTLKKMNVIWKSDIPDALKRIFFRANVELLIYGAPNWTLTKNPTV